MGRPQARLFSRMQNQTAANHSAGGRIGGRRPPASHALARFAGVVDQWTQIGSDSSEQVSCQRPRALAECMTVVPGQFSGVLKPMNSSRFLELATL